MNQSKGLSNQDMTKVMFALGAEGEQEIAEKILNLYVDLMGQQSIKAYIKNPSIINSELNKNIKE